MVLKNILVLALRLCRDFSVESLLLLLVHYSLCTQRALCLTVFCCSKCCPTGCQDLRQSSNLTIVVLNNIILISVMGEEGIQAQWTGVYFVENCMKTSESDQNWNPPPPRRCHSPPPWESPCGEQLGRRGSRGAFTSCTATWNPHMGPVLGAMGECVTRMGRTPLPHTAKRRSYAADTCIPCNQCAKRWSSNTQAWQWHPPGCHPNSMCQHASTAKKI